MRLIRIQREFDRSTLFLPAPIELEGRKPVPAGFDHHRRDGGRFLELHAVFLITGQILADRRSSKYSIQAMLETLEGEPIRRRTAVPGLGQRGGAKYRGPD